MKKTLYLFVALLLPGLVFVFLKYAGKNEFAIPVYYELGVENPPADCGMMYPKPYHLPDSIWRKSGMHQEANVLVFPSPGLDFVRLQSVLSGEFDEGKVGLNQAVLLIDSTGCDRWKKCVFLLNDPWQTVLLDGEKRIRGYYDLRNRDEEDRLRVELKILLKKY